VKKDLTAHLKSLFRVPKTGHAQTLPFDLLFKRFRDVLDSNNRALEIITDMGEKLGGDYLFDIHYIKESYSGLYAAMQDSLQYFEALTSGRYHKLGEVFKRIDSQITRVIYDLSPSSGEYVLPYAEITWDMARDVGGKNAALAEIRNQVKLDVPEAFAVTTRAYNEFLEHNGLKERIDRLSEDTDITEATLDDLQNAILYAEIPPPLSAAIEKAVSGITARCGKDCFLAVRSSAEEEDGEFSFAGQFRTVLNVPPERKAVEEAYKEVVASLFSADPLSYQKKLGYEIGRLRMAVGCVAMVDAVCSGVIYSANPNGDTGTLLLNATWGLGAAVVQGQADADLYLLRKDSLEVREKRIANKEFMIVSRKDGGTERVKVPGEKSTMPCLTPEQAADLAALAISLERHFRSPQDIEWAINREGKILILQSRSLSLPGAQEDLKPLKSEADYRKITLKNKGTVVQKGIGGGRAFVFRHMDQIDKFPKGAVLVAGSDSSSFVRLMPYASAIITDRGTPTSHMASLSREFRVPTVVDAGNATETIRHGQEVTLYADDQGNTTLYEGIVGELIQSVSAKSVGMQEVFEFRKKRYVLRYVSPLNLIDPLMDDFSPEGCKTIHDVLRFIHEKSVAELVENAKYSDSMLRKHAAVSLDLPIPTGIMVVDIGGGLSETTGGRKAAFEQIISLPLKAIIRGMLHPGVWHSEAVSLKVNDFLSSMMRMPDITSDSSRMVGYNVAVVSGEYMNLSLRFGYHFNMLDCYCSSSARNNHIYFRFVGGATDMVKRSRRVELISTILREFGFNIKTKGDLIIARLANIGQDEMERILDQMGRLIAYTRQLDALLHDDSSVEHFAANFLKGDYEY
jgi:pyruvate,water dikinase